MRLKRLALTVVQIVVGGLVIYVLLTILMDGLWERFTEYGDLAAQQDLDRGGKIIEELTKKADSLVITLLEAAEREDCSSSTLKKIKDGFSDYQERSSDLGEIISRLKGWVKLKVATTEGEEDILKKTREMLDHVESIKRQLDMELELLIDQYQQGCGYRF
jgi:hypothetical protein